MGAQVVTITEDVTPHNIRKIKWVWNSADDGTVSSKTAHGYSGLPVRVIFDPDAAATQPTDQYDVTILDDDGYDILNGQGANLSNAANVYKGNNDGLLLVKESNLTLTIANAGDNKGGVVILYLLNGND